LYALGCILVELVTWKRLVDVMSDHVSVGLREKISAAVETNEVFDLPALSELFDNREAVRFLKYQAGETLVEAIRLLCYCRGANGGYYRALRRPNGRS
jgi:hypothetical protein